MMDACSVEIVTRSEGAVSCFSARGKVERADGCFLVSYIQDGDAVALDARERSLLMQRTGDCSLRVEFLLGRRSVMTVSGGALLGEIPVITSVYSFRRTEDGFFCRLNYELLFPADSQKFFLEISVQIISEEK